MGSVKGTNTIITCDDDVLTGVNTSTLSRSHGVGDTTAYGADDEGQVGLLGKHQFTCGGWYDKTATTGNRAVLQPLADSGDTVEWTRSPEGTGSGLPIETFNGFVSKYDEQSPVKDITTWTCTVEVDGGIVTTSQS
jgi:hypothetical protein